MPTLTFSIECTDEQAGKIFSILAGNKPTEAGAASASGSEPSALPIRANHDVNKIATEFARLIKSTANAGYSRQLKTMKAWLAANGNARLIDLVKASGVKKQHDYSGVGGSLSKNMRKASGTRKRAHDRPAHFPEEWYSTIQDPPNEGGEWRYVIAHELVEPLKSAFAQLPA